MTENSPLVGAPWGADNLRTASASFGGPSSLKNATGRYKLGLTEASIWRISDDMNLGLAERETAAESGSER